jgi:tetratricopeptide (TPR) repeat protein
VFVPPVPKGIARDGVVRTPAQPIAFPAEDRPWVRVRSAHFDILSSLPEARTRDIARELEVLTAALTQDNPRFRRSAVPTRIFVFAQRRESQPYFDLLLQRERSNATGLFVRHSGGGAMIVDGARAWRSNRTAMHELVHDLLAQNDTHAPLWVEEGLAEYFSAAKIWRNSVTVGQPIREAAAYVRKRGTMPSGKLLAMKSSDSESTSTQFYAQSWAAVAWLMRTDREAFYRFLRDLESGTPTAEALQTHYRKSMRDFESATQSVTGFDPIRIDVQNAATDVETKALDRATLLYELGVFLSIVEGAEKEAQRHFDAALTADPGHAPTRALLLVREAESLLSDAIGPFAGVFEQGDAGDFRKARALLERALILGADEARAAGDLAITYVVEPDLAAGIAHLEHAMALAPRRDDVALHLYTLLLRAGDRTRADALFASRFANARDPQTAFAARNILLRVESDRASALSREGKLAEAAAIVRTLAAATPDLHARADLERQAAALEATAEINRQIVLYNEAVADVNAGRKRDAIRKLDALLAVAKDEKVRDDARRLRRELPVR